MKVSLPATRVGLHFSTSAVLGHQFSVCCPELERKNHDHPKATVGVAKGLFMCEPGSGAPPLNDWHS